MCGGESKRMGSDKGLLSINASTWAQYMAAMLEQLQIEVVISVNNKQIQYYNQVFPSEKLVIDQVKANGPLKGLLSVHHSFPERDLLLIACDMIDMDFTTLNNLLNVYLSDPSFDLYVHESANFIEPLCAIYSAKALNTIMDKLNSNLLPSFALHKLMNPLNCKKIVINDKKRFLNYNTAIPPVL